MAKDGGQGGEVMSAVELKPLLLLAKRQPVSCAIGMTRDKQGVILLHKRTKPRKLTAELLRQGKSAGLELDRASIRFGRASVDGGSDSTTVNFTINKEPAGPLHMKMVEKLRPAGFQRCKFTVDAKLEDEGDEDETNEPEEGVVTTRPRQDAGSAAYSPTAIPDAPLAAPSLAQATAPTAPSKAEFDASAGADSNGQATATQPDAAALKATLRGLTEQIRPVLAADPSRGASLVKIATRTRDSLANGDLAATQAGIDNLRRQLKADGDGSPSKPSLALLTPALFSNAPAEPTAPTPSLASRGTMEAVSEGGAEILGGLVLRFAVGAVSFVATLLIPTNTQRSSRGETVDGRPNMAGTVTTAPGSRSGHVTIRLHGQHGQPDCVLGTFIMDPDGRLTDGVQGAVLGTVGVGSIHLTPEGEAELLKRAGETLTPSSGPQQPTTPPIVPPDLPVQYDPNDPEEAELVGRMHGRSGMEIQNAINALRERRRVQGLPVNATGRRRSAEPVPNALPPADRHYLNRIKLNSQPKAKNTVILPGTDIQPDVKAIREGRALRDGSYYVVGDRYYEMHEGGRLYPVQGPGFILLDRGAFRALCILTSLGDTPAAELMLDRQGISEEQRRAARGVRRQK